MKMIENDGVHLLRLVQGVRPGEFEIGGMRG